MDTGSLGRLYQDGEVIIREGEVGNCMYVIQEGQVEILREGVGEDFHIAMRRKGDFFGEMAIFDREVRSATVRAVGQAYVITVDKKNFLRRVHADPSLAFRLVETMSHRIRELNDILDRLRDEQPT
jgi:CRP-like cAMP-binding protein